MAKGYLIAHVTVNDPAAYQEYIDKNTPLIHAAGGRFIVRGGRNEIVEGESYQRHVVIEFDSFEAVQAYYNSPEYQQVAEIRKNYAESTVILVEGV